MVTAPITRAEAKRLSPGDQVRFMDPRKRMMRTYKVEYVGRQYLHLINGGDDIGGGVIAPIKRVRIKFTEDKE